MSKRAIVILTAIAAISIFAVAGFLYDRDRTATPSPAQVQTPVQPPSQIVRPQPQAQPQPQASVIAPASGPFVRAHSPVMGPPNAKVTIAEFFDPACESCRAFYPIVKQIMAAFPNDVRLVIRYTPLHKGSDEAVRILEAARLQNRFEPVIETLLAMQPNWASHGAPNLEKAWQAAAIAGLDLARARVDAAKPEITEILRQDLADFKTVNGRGTPTFFVNEKPLPSFGAQQLYDMVRDEIIRVSGTK